MSRFNYIDSDDEAVATVLSNWVSPVSGCLVDYPLSDFREPAHTNPPLAPACYVDYEITYQDAQGTLDLTAAPVRNGFVTVTAWVQKGHRGARAAARDLQQSLAEAFVVTGDGATLTFTDVLPFTRSRRERDAGFEGRGVQVLFVGT